MTIRQMLRRIQPTPYNISLNGLIQMAADLNTGQLVHFGVLAKTDKYKAYIYLSEKSRAKSHS